MPIYSYKCSACQNELEALNSTERRLDCPKCSLCGRETEFILSAAKKADGIYPFIDDNMDHKPVKITSLAHYRRELKARGLQEIGAGRGNKGQWI